MKNYWYEVFESINEGTRTLCNCETLKEARTIKKKLKKFNKNELHIDKWMLANGISVPIKEFK